MASEDHKPQHEIPPPRNLRRIGLIAAAAAILIAALGILQRHSHEAEVAQWTKQQAVPIVALITPESGAAVQHLTLPGTVHAWYEAPIYARVPGYLKNWYFDYGAHVKKGDVLAEIETPDLDAQLAAVQGKLNSAHAVVKIREAEKQFAEFDLSALAGFAQGRRLGAGAAEQAGRLQQRPSPAELCDGRGRRRSGRSRSPASNGKLQEHHHAIRRRRHRTRN